MIPQRGLFVALAGILTTGCSVAELAPPPAPAPIRPAVPDPRAMAPTPGAGHVVLDAEGGAATVSRVVSTSEVVAYGTRATAMERREVALLCTTPCVVDLPLGTHDLVFRRRVGTEEPESTARVTVSGEPLVVRHALGDERVTYRTGYALGFVSLFAGVGFTLIGGLALTAGALTKSEPTGNRSTTFLGVGSVLAGVGAVLDVTGIVAILVNRPTRREGATTTFTF